MKKQTILIATLFTMVTTFTSCELAKGIFKAGMGVGVFIVVFIIALIVFLIAKLGRK